MSESSKVIAPKSGDDLKKIHQIINALDDYDDRELIIVGTSIIEDALRDMLRSKSFKDLPTKFYDYMFQGSGSLSTFSARIKTSYMLGFIPDEIYQDLLLIKKVRNICAHSYNKILVSDPAVKSVIDNLRHINIQTAVSTLSKIDPSRNFENDGRRYIDGKLVQIALVDKDHRAAAFLYSISEGQTDPKARFSDAVKLIWYVIFCLSVKPYGPPEIVLP